MASAQGVPSYEKRAALRSEAFESQPPVAPVETMAVAAGDGEGAAKLPQRTWWDVVKVLPIAFYTPETRLGFGAGSLVLFALPGAVAKRRPSSVSLAGIYTLENQTIVQVVPDLRFGNDDFVLHFELLGTKFPSRFYGTGGSFEEAVYDTFTDRYLRGSVDARVRPFREGSPLRDIFVGAEYRAQWSTIEHVRPHRRSQPGLLSALNDPGEREQIASGGGPVLAWDSRDGLNWPLGGSYVEFKSLFFEPVFGSSVRYRSVALDARRYQPLWFSHVLALRLVHRSTWGAPPFQQLPQLGGANLFRGWYAGKLRDRSLTAIEAEYRLPVGPRWAFVGFGSLGQVASHPGDFAVHKLRAAGGGGLRFAVSVEARTNIRVDVAYGDALQIYAQFREAF